MNHQELIERMRVLEIDHEPNGWPAIQMRDISAMCDAIESLLAENERLKAELAKYRDAPVVAWGHYDYAEKTADYLQHFKDTYASIPLIVKPGE